MTTDPTPSLPLSPRLAPLGYVWQCAACGKTSADRYGDEKSSPWWDESCALNAVLVKQAEVKP